jgi:spore coat protein CotH
VVDGKTYRDVGVHFRGQSSYFGVPAGRKHSLNVSIDFAHANQRLGGYSTLNLLNSNQDPSYLRTILYLEAARSYIPAPKANFARVVINGEGWGVFVSAQQFNKELINEWFKTTDGARWKTPGSPGGRAGLEYLGDDVAPYRTHYEIKSKDDPKSWAALVNLTKVLNQTPADQLAQALAPILDVDGALKFLALETTLVNEDGYWIRASDYSIYLDPKGRFHLLPHDANETFFMGFGGRGGGLRGAPPPPQMGRGPAGRGGVAMGPELDPLVGLNETAKPLRSKLLAVPALRERYMKYVHDIAAKWLDWNRLGPLVTKYQAIIDADMKADTKKIEPYEAFVASSAGLKSFAERRRAFLASYKPPQ